MKIKYEYFNENIRYEILPESYVISVNKKRYLNLFGPREWVVVAQTRNLANGIEIGKEYLRVI